MATIARPIRGMTENGEILVEVGDDGIKLKISNALGGEENDAGDAYVVDLTAVLFAELGDMLTKIRRIRSHEKPTGKPKKSRAAKAAKQPTETFGGPTAAGASISGDAILDEENRRAFGEATATEKS